jgi:hypothetical protein
VIAYCEQEHISFTRGRPYLKNDQCFVEQKNGAIVRQVVGYDRLVGEQASASTHRTLPCVALVCQLLSTFHETAVETARRQKSAPCLRLSQNSPPTAAPVRSPACPEAARAARGGTQLNRLTILFWHLLCDTLMRPGSIEVLDIGMKDTVQLLLLEDEQVIETLTTDTPQKAFTDRIGPWCVIRRDEHLDAARVCDSSETGSKRAVMITDEVVRRLPIGSCLTQLLGSPGVDR